MSHDRVREVVSAANPLFKQLRKQLSEPGAYRKSGQVWLEGDHLCRAFLARGGQPLEAVVSARAWGQPLWRELAQSAPQVTVLSDALMDALSPLESPAPGGFWVPMPGSSTPSRPTGELDIESHAATVVLDRLQDPGNVGSILRSASALGVKQVLALKGSVALWSPKVLRAGMGAHFALRLVEGVLPEALTQLQVPLLATSSHAQLMLPDAPCAQPCAWVFGHEGGGVAEALLARCAFTVGIPQPGGEESLNAAAAAAICLYESARRAGT